MQRPVHPPPKPERDLDAGDPCCARGKDNQNPRGATRVASTDMGAVAAPRVRLARLVCVSSLHTACGGPSGGEVEDPGDFTLEAGLCRRTSADESALGGLMDHLEIPSLQSSVKDLGSELASWPGIRATRMTGKNKILKIEKTTKKMP